MDHHAVPLPLSPESIAVAHFTIAQYIHRTPLVTSKTLDEIASSADPGTHLTDDPPLRPHPGNDEPGKNIQDSVPLTGVPKFCLYFKAENLQRGGAFKVRGAFFTVQRLADELGIAELRARGVVTHSSGNHAQALALAASTFDVPAYIVMPCNTTPSKIAGARRYATEIVLAPGSTQGEREECMRGVQKRTNAVFVPPFDHVNILLGQGTLAREMAQQLEELGGGNKADFDAVVAPLGGGGLLGGVATWFGDKPQTRVYGAEPSFEGANDGQRGLRQEGKRIEVVKSLTIADGLRMPVGILNWEVVSDSTKVRNVYSVSEDEIKIAMRLVFERLKLVAEPSACVPLAVVLFNTDFRSMVAQLQAQEGKPVWHLGIVLSGGNTSMEKISFMFGSQASSGN